MIIVNLFFVIEYAPTDPSVVNNPYWRLHLKPFADTVLPRKPILIYLAAHLEILNLILVVVSIIR